MGMCRSLLEIRRMFAEFREVWAGLRKMRSTIVALDYLDATGRCEEYCG